MNQDHPILFFDGDCNLCNQAVQWVILADRKQKFRFASLESEFAKSDPRLTNVFDKQIDSIVFLHGESLLVKSKAVFAVCRTLGGFWRILEGFRILPTPFLDRCYDWVAAHRIRLFGRSKQCWIQTDEHRQRFI